MKNLFRKLVFNADAEEWNEWDLPKLSGLQLRTLAMLWGCPKSGNKEKVVIRILATRQIRFKLARFNDDPGLLAAEFLKCDLKQMCKEAGLWRSGNKRQLAAGLLTWRNRCRHEGKKLLDQMLAESEASAVANAEPQQLKLVFT